MYVWVGGLNCIRTICFFSNYCSKRRTQDLKADAVINATNLPLIYRRSEQLYGTSECLFKSHVNYQFRQARKNVFSIPRKLKIDLRSTVTYGRLNGLPIFHWYIVSSMSAEEVLGISARRQRWKFPLVILWITQVDRQIHVRICDLCI